MRTSSAVRLAFVTSSLIAVEAAPGSAQTQALIERIDRRLEAQRTELIEIRRDIHRHPEVSGQEARTAEVVAERLRTLGLEVQSSVGGHGVVGILRGAKPGPVVAFRADMDAVFSNAPDPVPFRSETPGVRHICGHDIHTTVGLALAESLSEVRDQLAGTVKFIFQPAEENIRGARAMIDEGVLSDPAPEAIFAYHSAPLEVGQIGSTEGIALPGLDRVTLTVRGEGDLEQAAAAYARAASSASRDDGGAPEDVVLAMIGRPHRRPDHDDWVVRGMVRAGSPTARARAKREIELAVAAVEFDGVAYELNYEDLYLPDMANDVALVRSTLETIRSVVGPDGLLESNTVTPYFSEDFALYQQHIPGALYWLGVSNSELGYVGMPHSPNYVADEESIFVGARVMAAVVIDYLAKN
ncbi:MAG: M20 family metallopeptidase [Gemmatimonadota bacterium]|nr:M20 family metallopeptidase [Gemmatimonadota bacterium]